MTFEEWLVAFHKEFASHMQQPFTAQDSINMEWNQHCLIDAYEAGESSESYAMQMCIATWQKDHPK